MKYKFLIIFAIIVFTSMFWFACDKIDQPLVLINESNFPDNPNDTLFFLDSVIVTEKQVLLEDFTGHRCVNCPEAAFLAHDMAEQYDRKLIIYAVHVGQLAEPAAGTDFYRDFRCATGTDLYNDFNLSALGVPIGMINRQEFSGFVPLPSFIWEQAVGSEFEKPSQATMNMKTAYFPVSGKIVIKAEAEFTEALEEVYKLVIFVVEDSIQAPQLNNNPEIGPDTLFNYVHRNVLHASVNTTYGELISPTGTIEQGVVYAKEYTFLPDESWNIKNIKFIAYIGKQDDVFNLTEIIQVAEVGIKTE